MNVMARPDAAYKAVGPLPDGHPVVRIGKVGVLLLNLGTPDAPTAPFQPDRPDRSPHPRGDQTSHNRTACFSDPSASGRAGMNSWATNPL